MINNMENIFDRIFTDPDFDQLNNLVRWNGLGRINNESVAHHSFIVSWFSRIIVEELLKNNNDQLKLEVVTYALFHDFDEMFSGDIGHTVKYNEFNGAKIKKLVDEFCVNMTKDKFKENTPTNLMLRKNLLGDVSDVAKSIVKLADWLSMSYYVQKEIRLGNKNLFVEYDYCSLKVKESSCKCLELMRSKYPEFRDKILNDIKKLNFAKYGR
jgi:5'-deoxynucleotidase YfbR-like HD superfamily hydrolase